MSTKQGKLFIALMLILVSILASSCAIASDDLREIDTAASKITVQGARYPEKLEQMTGR